MDMWLFGSIVAAISFGAGVIAGWAYENWRFHRLYEDRIMLGDKAAKHLRDRYREAFPEMQTQLDDIDHGDLHRFAFGKSSSEKWSTCAAEVTSDDTPLRQRPPNIGGIGNPPYEGPNYFSQSEIAEEMKSLMRFHEPKPEEAWPVDATVLRKNVKSEQHRGKPWGDTNS